MEMQTESATGGESQISTTDANEAAVTEASASATENTQQADGQAAANAIAEQAQFTPNFKFKVGDEEKEFDEFVRGAIKDAETEKKIRDLYTRAHGLEPLKTRLTGEVESWKTKTTEAVQKYGALSESLQALSHYVNKGDFDSFFGALKIPEQAVYKWLQGKIQEQDMTPEQRANLVRQREESQRLYMLERQNQELMQKQQAFQVEQNLSLVDSTINSPEVSAIAQAFDQKVGTPGAFRNEVLKRGVALYHLHGRDLSPAEVVQDLLATMGKVIGPVTQTAQTQTPAATQKPPIIPNIAARSNSPVKTAPKSIKELKERAASM